MLALLKGIAVATAGLALGLWATWASLGAYNPVAGAVAGPWRIEARAGAADADPYTRARVERSGEIPLALGEGLMLTARADSAGRPLDGRCLYRVGPQAPAARFWTLEAIDGAGYPRADPFGRFGLRSTEVLREADGTFWVWLSPGVHAGNWLPTGGAGGFGLALRLYDPALGDPATGFEGGAAPEVRRERCA